VNPRRLVLGLVLLTLAAGACALPSLRVMEEHGVNVVCYQLARTTGQASEYNRMLGGEGRDATRTALWWDFPLMVSYGLLLAVLCLGVATQPRTPPCCASSTGRPTSRGQASPSGSLPSSGCWSWAARRTSLLAGS
jgi:hypothetical protein